MFFRQDNWGHVWLYKKFVYCVATMTLIFESTSRTTVFIDMRNHVKFFFGHVLANVEVSILFFGVKISYSIYVCSTSTHNCNFLTSFLFKLLTQKFWVFLIARHGFINCHHMFTFVGFWLTYLRNLVESKLCQDDDLGIYCFIIMNLFILRLLDLFLPTKWTMSSYTSRSNICIVRYYGYLVHGIGLVCFSKRLSYVAIKLQGSLTFDIFPWSPWASWVTWD